ncbi:MAG TPA: hypothetical protein VIR79_00340 [Nitrospira sp.]
MIQQLTQFVTRQGREHSMTVKGGMGQSVFAIPDFDSRATRREDQYELCSYEMVDHLGSESAILESGLAYTINRSEGGMLLLMPRAPETGRYLELHVGPTVGWRAAYVFEARWSKAVTIGSEGDLYLVGCQRTFGPCRYGSF